MSRAQACRRQRRRPTRPVAQPIVPQGLSAKRSGDQASAARLRSRRERWSGSIPGVLPGTTPDTPGLRAGAWPDRSVLKPFLSGKTVRKAMACPSQAGSPGSSPGLDARRLEELYGVNERVCEQVGEQVITRYGSFIDPGISGFPSSAQFIDHLIERLFEIQGVLRKDEDHAALWLLAFLLQVAFRDAQVRFAVFCFPYIKKIGF